MAGPLASNRLIIFGASSPQLRIDTIAKPSDSPLICNYSAYTNYYCISKEY